MTNIKSGDGDNNDPKNLPENPDDGGFLAGAGGDKKPTDGDKPATPSAADADKAADGTIAGAGADDKSKKNLKTNLSTIFNWGWKAFVFGPPLLYGLIAVGDVMDGRGFGHAANTVWTGSTNVWRTVVDVPVGAARGAAGLLENNVVTTGPRAEVVLYCPPRVRNTNLSAEDATRVFAETNEMRGLARGMIQGSINDVTRAAQNGGYPILVGTFSDRANGRPLPTVSLEIAPTAASQTCPQGDWATPQSWPLLRQ